MAAILSIDDWLTRTAIGGFVNKSMTEIRKVVACVHALVACASARRALHLSATGLAFVVSLWVVALDNRAFWRVLWDTRDSSSWRGSAAVSMLAVVLWALLATALRGLFWRWMAKPVACLVLLTSAVLAHFIDTFGVVIDRGMIRNALETDLREIADLLSLRWWLDVGLRGLVPAAFVALAVQIKRSSSWRRETRDVLALVLGTTTLTLATTAAFFADYAATARNQREVRHLLTPTNALNALWGIWKERRPSRTTLATVGSDATRKSSASLDRKPLMVVLVVGETARAANFSLGGYGRPTNVALNRPDLVYFSNVVSCGTDTATSLPCMFSDIGTERFSITEASARENILDVLVRAGVDAAWIENTSGCKEVCKRVPTKSLFDEPQRWCGAATCFDDVLVPALQQAADASAADKLVVLHMQGSHGPAYFKRYPPTARRFTPTCDTNSIQGCDLESLRNTYDNSIAFTSDVLARSIEWLERASSRKDIVLLYLSDHGESLGEGGLYLHGLPRRLAPRTQVQVPMLMWVSPGAARRLGVTPLVLQASSDAQYSHDNLFHTLLGAFEIDTAAYRSGLDIFAIARSSGPRRRTAPP